MRVLVTGGTGFIGSAVVKDLISAGHEVIGLARTNASAERLKSFGATPCEGSLEDVDGLKDMAKSAESVIHMAFAHDFANFGEAAEKDIRAIQALGEGLAIQATNNPFVVTSGVPLGVIGQVATEEVDSDKDFPRKSEAAALPFADCGVRVSIVRPSRFVHGIGDLHGFIPQLIGIARKAGFSAYIGDGKNRIQAVNILDAATLFRLALEKGTAGARYQAVGDPGVEFGEIAKAIAKGLDIPFVSISQGEAMGHFGFLGMIVGVDNPASSEATQKALGWRPGNLGLLEDLESGAYFA